MAGGKSKKDLSNKAKQAQTKKVVEDKTFGLKNKNKSKKVQMYVKQVVKATEMSFVDQKKQKELDAKKKAKEDKKKHKEETDALFKQAIIQPKVPFGVDPKTIACAFFKAGQCKKKGDACKFSHDQEICFGKKKAVGNKIDLSIDVTKEKGKKKEEEDIAITDPVELQKAIEKKLKQQACETHIVCKFFLEAIEKKKYGWFWECPANKDGQVCKYRHALPPGYVFKDKKSTEEDDEEDQMSIEEKLEQMRKGVGPGAMVTAETFAEWKRKRNEKAEQARQDQEAAAQKGYKRGAKTNLTGRQLFEFDSSVFVDDDQAGGADVYIKEFEDAEMAEVAKAGVPVNTTAAAAADSKPAAAVAIEENLFLGEDLDDLPDDDEEKEGTMPGAEAAAVLPEGIEENLFLENLDDLPSDEED